MKFALIALVCAASAADAVAMKVAVASPDCYALTTEDAFRACRDEEKRRDWKEDWGVDV